MRRTFWFCGFLMLSLAAGAWSVLRPQPENEQVAAPPQAAALLAPTSPPTLGHAEFPQPALPGAPSALRADRADRADRAEPTSTEPPHLQAARAYRASKTNIHFNRTELLQALLARDEDAVQHLADALQAPPQSSDASEDAPNGEVLDRMAAIDLLEGFAQEALTATNQPDARGALEDLALREPPTHLDAPPRGVMAAEKYDAFTALTRVDPALAVRAYRALPSAARREALKPALLAGLIDRGVPRSEAAAQFDRLTAAAR